LTSPQRIGAPAALRLGLARLASVKRAILLAYLANLVLAAGLGAVVYVAVGSDLGPSLAGQRMTEGFDSLWHSSFSARAMGTAATLSPSATGFGAVLDALDDYLAGSRRLLSRGPSSGVLGALLLYLLLRTFLAGGFISTFVQSSHPRGDADLPQLLQRAARCFPRMLVLTAIGIGFYWLVFGPIRSRLEPLVARATADTIDERVSFTYTLLQYSFLWLLLWIGGLILGYAKIAAVRQGDKNFLKASWMGLQRGARLVFSHPLSIGSLSALVALLWLALALAYGAAVPGAGISSPAAIAATFLLGQLYIVGQIGLRCLVYSSQSALSLALDPKADDTSARTARGDIP
jgi:hypothetical protein